MLLIRSVQVRHSCHSRSLRRKGTPRNGRWGSPELGVVESWRSWSSPLGSRLMHLSLPAAPVCTSSSVVVSWLKSPQPCTPAGSPADLPLCGPGAAPWVDLGLSLRCLVATPLRHTLLAGETPEAKAPQRICLRSLSLGLWPPSGIEGTARLYLF